MDLFEAQPESTENTAVPLAEKLRPSDIETFEFDQLGEAKVFAQKWFEGKKSSALFYGPPGVGKTSLMNLLHSNFKNPKYKINAVDVKVAQLRQISTESEEKFRFNGAASLLLVDEAHRLSSAQQDALLPSLESGSVILLGATTENPYFSFARAFLSRLKKIQMSSLSEKALESLFDKGWSNMAFSHEPSEKFKTDIIKSSFGDGRRLLSSIQSSFQLFTSKDGVLDEPAALKSLDFETAKSPLTLRADGMSALIKTMRCSDEKAAVYYLGLLLKAKEDPLVIFRRLSVFCSEDVGPADHQSILIIYALREGFVKTGLPEGLYALYHAVSYLATAAKSRKYGAQIKWVADTVTADPASVKIPAHLRIKNLPNDEGASNLPDGVS
jgi:putative ATPase